MRRIAFLAGVALVIAVLAACTATARAPAASPRAGAVAAGAPAAPGPFICGRPVLDSPWDYRGAATTFTSGQYPGLPTFGSAGTDFPSATAGIIVPAGDNTAAALANDYRVNGTVIYFEPGTHDIETTMDSGHDSDYVGGYAPSQGKAVIDGVDGATDGTGTGGDYFTSSTTEASGASNVVNDKWQYLTIENYTTISNSTPVLGEVSGGIDGGIAEDETYKYDTIGPNLYGYTGPSSAPAHGKDSGAGYAISGGSGTTVEYDCFTQDGQGAFNIGDGTDINVADSEFSYNGLGNYPDEGGPGGSSFACGCSGGMGKFFFTANATITDNYVHDNYADAGIWFDTDNTGALISHNYVSDTWGEGIMYEASYNADISDNTVIGNGWNADGIFPAGDDGGAGCTPSDLPCQDGLGYMLGRGGGFPYSAIYIPNSGGTSDASSIALPSWSKLPGCSSGCGPVASRYDNELLVEGNVLTNNFGGTMIYTDTNRWTGNTGNDTACAEPAGALNQQNNSTYYQQHQELTVNGDGDISGNAVTTAGGTLTVCADYNGVGYYGGALTSFNEGLATGGSDASVAAPVTGMAVYNENSGDFLGKVATVTSAHSFTLSDSPGNETNADLLLSSYGGCGVADYYPQGSGAPGADTGTPSDPYWDNCIFGSRNVTVKGNIFSMNAGAVANCTLANNCGFNGVLSYNPGEYTLLRFWQNYQDYIAKASGGLGNVFSHNAYTWTGGGAGAWSFWAGVQGNTVSQSGWQASPYGQDAGSTFSS